MESNIPAQLRVVLSSFPEPVPPLRDLRTTYNNMAVHYNLYESVPAVHV